MENTLNMVVEPFVRRGLFATPESAVLEMAREYLLHQIEHYRTVDERMHEKYGMTYEQFNTYLEARSQSLMVKPNVTLNQAVMLEEEDALTWKSAQEMLQAWLGLKHEVGV